MYVRTQTRRRKSLGQDNDTFYWNQDPSVGPVVTGNPQAIAVSKTIAAEGSAYTQAAYDQAANLAQAQQAAQAATPPEGSIIVDTMGLGLGLNFPPSPSVWPWYVWAGLALGAYLAVRR